MSKTYLSAILIIDELPHLDHVPWVSSVNSVLSFADELIVVHGGHTTPDGRKPVVEYFSRRADSRIRVIEYPWPDNFNWMQIARSCAFGLLHAHGKWCFRVLADEVFPSEFQAIPEFLEAQPSHIKIVSVMRHYMLGNTYAYPLHDKPLFFRHDGSVGYGTINPDQGEAAMPSLFDDPIDVTRWFDGHRVIRVEPFPMQYPEAARRLLEGETPRGFRDLTGSNTVQLNMGILNVDVNYLPDSMILAQKDLSIRAYERLPPGYWNRPLPQGKQMLDALIQKVEGMLRKRLVRINPPDDLLQFIDRNDFVFNVIRELCETKYGLPWNRISGRTNAWRCLRTVAANRLRNLFRLP